MPPTRVPLDFADDLAVPLGIVPESRANRSATCKAVENDCLVVT